MPITQGLGSIIRSEPNAYERFVEAIEDVGEPPCKGCPYKRDCATRDLACVDFRNYANAEPFRTTPEPDAAHPLARFEDFNRQPSKKVYDKIFSQPAVESLDSIVELC